MTPVGLLSEHTLGVTLASLSTRFSARDHFVMALTFAASGFAAIA